MKEFLMVEANGRTITGDDKIFGIAKLAKDMQAKVGAEHVIDATIGSLLDDNGKLIVFSSVVEVLKSLSPEDFAEYAPIAGVPEYLDSVKKAVFGNYKLSGYSEAVATPGGTGSIRNTIQNFSKRGDTVLTCDWYWSPYMTIAEEIERKLDTYTFFDENDRFNGAALAAKMDEYLEKQDGIVVILNVPAHNPTGFIPSSEDWDNIIAVLKNAAAKPGKKVTVLLDVAYLDFAGTDDEARSFLPKLDHLPENILVIFGFSMSKGYTLYGMRSGAMICLTQSEAVAKEFKDACMFSNRGSWSNGTRSAMVTLARVYNDEALLNKVASERTGFREMLAKRGEAFMTAAKEAGLSICPFGGGYFITVRCENAEEVGKEMQKAAAFAVPIGQGIRIAISAISEESCRKLPAIMAEAIRTVNGKLGIG